MYVYIISSFIVHATDNNLLSQFIPATEVTPPTWAIQNNECSLGGNTGGSLMVITSMSDNVIAFPGCSRPAAEGSKPLEPFNTYLNENGKQVFSLWEDRDKLSVLISHNPLNPHIDYDLLSNQPIHAMYMIGMLEHLISRLKGRL